MDKEFDNKMINLRKNQPISIQELKVNPSTEVKFKAPELIVNKNPVKEELKILEVGHEALPSFSISEIHPQTDIDGSIQEDFVNLTD